MSPRDTTKMAVSAALLLGAGAVLASWLWPERSAAQQEVTCWLCTESTCGKEFTKPVMELARLRQGNPDANPACPYCGKATSIRAVPCPFCGAYLKPLSHGRLPKSCPKCAKVIVPDSAATAPAASSPATPGGTAAPEGAGPGAPPAGGK